jgi:predicted secreted protein
MTPSGRRTGRMDADGIHTWSVESVCRGKSMVQRIYLLTNDCCDVGCSNRIRSFITMYSDILLQ